MNKEPDDKLFIFEINPKSMYEFNIGDVVALKSGGPKMTVHRIIGNSDLDMLASAFKGADKGDIECKWFDNGRIESAYFKGQMLMKVPEN